MRHQIYTTQRPRSGGENKNVEDEEEKEERKGEKKRIVGGGEFHNFMAKKQRVQILVFVVDSSFCHICIYICFEMIF